MDKTIVHTFRCNAVNKMYSYMIRWPLVTQQTIDDGLECGFLNFRWKFHEDPVGCGHKVQVQLAVLIPFFCRRQSVFLEYSIHVLEGVESGGEEIVDVQEILWLRRLSNNLSKRKSTKCTKTLWRYKAQGVLSFLKGACDENVTYIDFLCARDHFCRRLRLFRCFFTTKSAIFVPFCYLHNHSSVEFAR